MARTVREARLQTRTSRAALKAGRQPHFRVLAGPNVCIGYQRHKGERNGHWFVRSRVGPNKYATMALGRADDSTPADGVDYLDYQQAVTAAHALLRTEKKLVSLEQMIKQKFMHFAERNIRPETYLYRHYGPDNDLLYVGITFSITDRHNRHFSESGWRDEIAFIVIEPFATRKEALDAEHKAIRTEFPKFNVVYNGRRSPMEELIHAGEPRHWKRKAIIREQEPDPGSNGTNNRSDEA